MKGTINIKGQIGDHKDAEGKIVKGFNLEDVVTQVESQKDAESFDVHIDSPGGVVEVGRAIAAYISKLTVPVTTIAENLCGSIATEIHLAVPVENRKIVAGTEYFIHNPLVEGISGDAAALKAAADYVEKYEKEMLSMYDKSVTADKEALKGLMALETSLNTDQCTTLGFVSEVLPKVELTALAFMPVRKEAKKNPTNIIGIDMDNLMSRVTAVIKAAMPERTPTVKAAMVATDKGELSYESDGALPTVGEAVTIDGSAAGEGDYTTENGAWIIKVDAEGNVAELVEVEASPADDNVEALKATIARLEKEKVDIAKGVEEVVKAEIDKVKKSIDSDYIPVAVLPNFKKDTATKKAVGDMKQAAIDRKEEYKAK